MPSYSGSSAKKRTIGYYEGWLVFCLLTFMYEELTPDRASQRPCDIRFPTDIEMTAMTPVNFGGSALRHAAGNCSNNWSSLRLLSPHNVWSYSQRRSWRSSIFSVHCGKGEKTVRSLVMKDSILETSNNILSRSLRTWVSIGGWAFNVSMMVLWKRLTNTAYDC